MMLKINPRGTWRSEAEGLFDLAQRAWKRGVKQRALRRMWASLLEEQFERTQ